MKVAFQGEPGAYSEAALIAHFGPEAEPVPCPAFDRIFASVEDGSVEFGLIPIENSLAGSILENYDLLRSHDLPIIGEQMLSVRHCLLAAPGTRLDDITIAQSHPQALAQSMPFLKRHGITPRAAYDTAGAARDLSLRPEPGVAAIASARAAAIYGLAIVAEGIQTRDDNTTRFFAIARSRPAGLPREKASLVFSASNIPGALHTVLGAFASRRLNLTKLESRPTLDRPWEYHFFVDFEGPDQAPLTPELVEGLMAELTAQGIAARLLGLYPRSRPAE